MAIGLVGIKRGMTRIFTQAGASIPVTVVEVNANRISQIKTVDTDGYDAIQITTGERRESRVTAAQKGHFAKAGVAAGRGVWEFRADASELEGREVGGDILVDLFEVGQLVDVTGQSKGKGFQGGVKRHNFRTQDATHGNSVSHRVLGSTGQNQTPGRVFKGKKCQVRWVTNVLLFKALKLCLLIPKKVYWSSKVPYLVLMVAMLSYVRQSKPS